MDHFGTTPFGGGFDNSFSFMSTVIPILVVIGLVVVIFGFISNGARYMKNSASPRESVYATVVSKRMDVRHHTNHHHHDNGVSHPTQSSRTYYYITLEFDNGERKEFLDVKNLYGLVVEGDNGYAATQGDWIVAFERSAP